MEKKTITVQGKPFVYNDESMDINYETTGEITEESAKKLMGLTQTLFHKIGVDVYLNFGTLLGAVREGGLIKGDSDVDVYVEDEQTMYDNLQYLSDNGLKLCRMFKRECYSFKADVGTTAYIDVYIKRPCGKFSIWAYRNCILHRNVTPKKFFEKGSREIEFLGIKCKCVKDPEDLLAFWYGDTWRIPVKSHEAFIYEIPAAHFVHTFPKRFVKFIIGYKYWKPFAKPDGKHWWFSKKSIK
ncbi:MAG: hypothetical protein NC388_09355 [Clostridium sp.]|nr:hypothetical protein [Clostridium sp.]